MSEEEEKDGCPGEEEGSGRPEERERHKPVTTKGREDKSEQSAEAQSRRARCLDEQ